MQSVVCRVLKTGSAFLTWQLSSCVTVPVVTLWSCEDQATHSSSWLNTESVQDILTPDRNPPAPSALSCSIKFLQVKLEEALRGGKNTLLAMLSPQFWPQGSWWMFIFKLSGGFGSELFITTYKGRHSLGSSGRSPQVVPRTLLLRRRWPGLSVRAPKVCKSLPALRLARSVASFKAHLKPDLYRKAFFTSCIKVILFIAVLTLAVSLLLNFYFHCLCFFWSTPFISSSFFFLILFCEELCNWCKCSENVSPMSQLNSMSFKLLSWIMQTVSSVSIFNAHML